MVDIGVYNSCKHFCKCCYTNFNEKQVNGNYKKHNPESSLLIGELEEDDIIKIRKWKKCLKKVNIIYENYILN